MAVHTLERENSSPNVEPSTESKPHYQRGCKITLGALSAMRMPTFVEARTLVLAKRASARILAPAAAAEIQRAWAAYKLAADEKRNEAAAVARRQAEARATVHVQTVWRGLAARRSCAQRLRAQHTIAAAYRKMAARHHAATTVAAAFHGFAQRRRHAQRLRKLLPLLLRIQRAVRGQIARARLRAALAAANLIQRTWRRVSDQVLRRRLARAADALRQGGRLGKYRKHGAFAAARERRPKFVWVSEDLQRLHWAPSAEQRAEASAVRTISMASITAVTDGCKTRLMKRMGRRAAAAHDPTRTASFGGKQSAAAANAGSLGGASVRRSLSFRTKPLSLDETCAFSVFSAGRVLDFVAEDRATRDRWLRDLRCVLTYAHHLDPTAAKLSVQRLATEPVDVYDVGPDSD